MEELIAILTLIPYGTEAAIFLGTATGACTIIAPIIRVIVHATKTKADDQLLSKIESNKVVKIAGKIGKQLKRFSLV